MGVYLINRFWLLVLFAFSPTLVSSKDMSLAQTPPLGWRSWNLFGPNVDQNLLQNIMHGLVSTQRQDHTGALVSLCDVGYCDVGLDDNWQDCGSPLAAPGMNYHTAEGQPLINAERFPSMGNMTSYAHSRGLTVGWYHNNCLCRDRCRNATECEAQIQGDVQALLDYNFDSVKLDGCGGETDLAMWDHYLSNASVVVENCHWGGDVPTTNEDCPYHMYRTSGDIRPNYGSVMHNLGTVEQYHAKNLSVPGCWAYPDMLQVGVEKNYRGDEGLTLTEMRSHFGAWAIVSSPLILSHDVNNETLTGKIWDMIANQEVIAVNQAYAGDSGGPFDASSTNVQLNDIFGWQAYPGMDNVPAKVEVWVPSYQFLSKPLGNSKVAVLLLNSANATAELVLQFDTVPGALCPYGACRIRDIWNHKTLGVFTGKWTAAVDSHDSAFVILEPATREDTTETQVPIEENASSWRQFAGMFFIVAPLVASVVLLFFARKRRTTANHKFGRVGSPHSNDDVDHCGDPISSGCLT